LGDCATIGKLNRGQLYKGEVKRGRMIWGIKSHLLDSKCKTMPKWLHIISALSKISILQIPGIMKILIILELFPL